LYEALEPALNAGEVELLDLATLTEQLVCLVWRGARIDHEPNGHDDHSNACAGVVHIVRSGAYRVPSVACIVVSQGARAIPGQ
jgi:hypothetical protein